MVAVNITHRGYRVRCTQRWRYASSSRLLHVFSFTSTDDDTLSLHVYFGSSKRKWDEWMMKRSNNWLNVTKRKTVR
uniref:Uncharacterized protein n=1 Tax=Onchocerca volvulus TaxID=6282 RepID=A0A8R1U0W3_ONCVO